MKSIFRTLKRLVLLMLAVLLAYQFWVFGWVVWWKWNPVTETNFMEIRLDELQEKNPQAKLQYQWVPYEKISMNLKRAVVAAEDDKFMEHCGFDWDGIEHALKKNQRKGKRVAGGSTITQQRLRICFYRLRALIFAKLKKPSSPL